MKIKNILSATIPVLFLVIVLASPVFSQNGNPPPPPPGHGFETNQDPGGSASLTGGIGILMVLGAAYGGRKLYKAFKSEDKPEE